MSAVYWNRTGGNDRLAAGPSAGLFWTASRVLCDVHWRWADGCYQTHQMTRDAQIKDLRKWPADNALSSLMRAVREDDRISGEPLLRLLGLYIAIEYTTALLVDRK